VARGRRRLAALALPALWVAAAAAEVAVPPLRARVTDLAGMLPADAEARLERELARLEAATTHQIAVLTVPSLEGEPIEAFALRAAEAWQLGQRGLDNGILLVVAAQDRRARIEVGYGLEGVVPDAVAKRILEERILPRFRAGDFAGGIEAGVAALASAARGERLALERRPARPGAPHEDPLSALGFAAMAGAMLSLPFRRARALRALLGGLASAGITWLLLASLGWALAGFAIGVAIGWLGLARGGRAGRGPVFLPGGPGWGGGRGRGGGFRGGGGRFGGGGASGGW
jgi:uncharacterized protein